MALDIFGAPVNNAGIDPIQGFDFECWAQDTASGEIAFFGRFQSLTLSIRDATETYLELGQRIPIYLNGEIQIAWVLEQGLLDMAFVVRTFGVQDITRGRSQTLSRGPRFHIAFDADAADRVSTIAGITTAPVNDPSSARTGVGTNQTLRGNPNNNNITSAGNVGKNAGAYFKTPRPDGRYELMRCKVDSVSLGIMPGRRVAAVRWEGVSEGITYVPQTVQEVKNQTQI